MTRGSGQLSIWAAEAGDRLSPDQSSPLPVGTVVTGGAGFTPSGGGGGGGSTIFGGGSGAAGGGGDGTHLRYAALLH